MMEGLTGGGRLKVEDPSAPLTGVILKRVKPQVSNSGAMGGLCNLDLEEHSKISR